VLILFKTSALYKSFTYLLTYLVVIAETEEDLIKRLNEWKNNVENRGMRVNMNKTKVMISGERQKPEIQTPVQKAARWPCGAVIFQFQKSI